MTSMLTVRELFVSADDGKLGASLRLPLLPKDVAQLVTGIEWKALGEHVFDLLDLNVVDILLAGWKKHQGVRRALRETAVDPSRTAVIHIAHHTLDSTHTPSIELRAQGRKVIELSFPIELAFDIEAVELTVRAGAVREIRPGGVKVRGTVKLENTVILERELSSIKLPGQILLGEETPSTSAVTSLDVAV